MGGFGGTARALLRIAAVACFVAGLFPHWSRTYAPDGERTDVTLGVSSPPAFEWHREKVESRGPTQTLEDGRRVESSYSLSHSWAFHVNPISWSAALLAAGAVLLALSCRRRSAAASGS